MIEEMARRWSKLWMFPPTCWCCRVALLALCLLLPGVTNVRASDLDVVSCPEECICASGSRRDTSSGPYTPITTDCGDRDLGKVPHGISNCTTNLILRSNHIMDLNTSKLTSRTFPCLKMVDVRDNKLSTLANCVLSRMPALVVAKLDHNPLKQLPVDVFKNAPNMQTVSCSYCLLTKYPSDAFVSLEHLQRLSLSGNTIKTVLADDLKPHPYLVALELEDCGLMEFPGEALNHTRRLTTLHLGSNKISELEDGDFDPLQNLEDLNLQSNKLTTLPSNVFSQQKKLRFLNLNNNELRTLPNDVFSSLTSLQHLSLDENPIEHFPDYAKIFDNLHQLLSLSMVRLNFSEEADGYLMHNQQIFWKLKNMKELHLVGRRENMPGFGPLLYYADNSLEKLYWGRHNFTQLDYIGEQCQLTHLYMPEGTMTTIKWDSEEWKIEGLCSLCRNLRDIDFTHNNLQELDKLQGCHSLTQLRLSYNQLDTQDIEENIANHSSLVDVLLAQNEITRLNEYTLGHMSSLERLYLAFNKITYIHPRAFAHLPMLQILDLDGNSFKTFPTIGFDRLRILNITIPSLHVFPEAHNYPALRHLETEYNFHCCRWETWSACDLPGYNETEEVGNGHYYSDGLGRGVADRHSSSDDEYWPAGLVRTLTDEQQKQYDKLWKDPQVVTHPPAKFENKACCRPHPHGLTPCFDLLGETWLRVIVWIVICLALLGNIMVLAVVGLKSQKNTQTRPIILNLAFADICMGVYLLALGIVDAATKGDFSQHAVEWKESNTCKAIGTLAVFSSSMSVFSLALVTVERYVTIMNALKETWLTKGRLRLIITCGWAVVIVLAVMPLVGINNYSGYVVCLPMATKTHTDVAYLVLLLSLTALSFVVIIACYVRIYAAVHNPPPGTVNTDYQIALRMAVLIFVDLCCWSPTWFLSFHALATKAPLISLQQAKYFIVLILPLNSCANPFLYAILTRNFQNDLVKIARNVPQVLQRRPSFMSPASGANSDKSFKDVFARLEREAATNARKALRSSSSAEEAPTNTAQATRNPRRAARNAKMLTSASSSSGSCGDAIFTTLAVVEIQPSPRCTEDATKSEAHLPSSDSSVTTVAVRPTVTRTPSGRTISIPAESLTDRGPVRYLDSDAISVAPTAASSQQVESKPSDEPPLKRKGEKEGSVVVRRTFLSPFTTCEDCSVSKFILKQEDALVRRQEARRQRRREKEEKKEQSLKSRAAEGNNTEQPRLHSASVAAATAALSGIVPMFVHHTASDAGRTTAPVTRRPQPPLTEKEMEGNRCSTDCDYPEVQSSSQPSAGQVSSKPLAEDRVPSQQLADLKSSQQIAEGDVPLQKIRCTSGVRTDISLYATSL